MNREHAWVWTCPLRWCDYTVMAELESGMVARRADHLQSQEHLVFMAEAFGELDDVAGG